MIPVCIVDPPLTPEEIDALHAYVAGASEPDPGALVARGFVQKAAKPGRGTPTYLVTPEGLAALLDAVPTQAITSGAAKLPSRVPRKSEGLSSSRARARS